MGNLPDSAPRCLLCDRQLHTEDEKSIELCTVCAITMNSDVKTASDVVSKYQDLANSETDPEKKILYWAAVLEELYRLKIKYYDLGVEPLDGDILDMIDTVIDHIANARL